MSNTYTKGYADGAALTESQLDTAYQTLQLDVANTTLMTTGSTTGQALISNGSAVAASFQTIPDPQGLFALRNYGIKATVATGVMTISLTTKAGTAPSGSDKVDFNYSTNGTTSATYSSVQVSGATTLTVNASATLGGVGTSAQLIYVYGYYNTAASAVKLAVSRRSDLDNGSQIVFTAMTASSDSPIEAYATAVLTVMPRILGSVSVAQTAAGAWQTPSKVNILNHASSNISSTNSWDRAATTSAARIGQVAISGTSGSFTTTSTSFTDVTNLSVTLTTSGRPVIITAIPSNVSTATIGGFSVIHTPGATGADMFIQILRNSTSLGISRIGLEQGELGLTGFTIIPPGSISALDSPSAGTHTYKMQIKLFSGNSVEALNMKLVAYEL